MNKQTFIELTGEDPEDMLGPDWQNTIDDYAEDNGLTHGDHIVGNCYICRDGI